MKRLLDISVSGAALALSLPFWLAIGACVLLTDGWPILYGQQRVGRGGRVFRVYKFRSVTRDAEKHSGAVLAQEDDLRITHIGQFLRKTALDETPQLLNILKGDMSWVGPRPERPEFVRDFLAQIPQYDLRHQVRPGLTGMAQVYGRYHTEADSKLTYDLYYLRNRSLWLDIRLFAGSWLISLKGRWASSAGQR